LGNGKNNGRGHGNGTSNGNKALPPGLPDLTLPSRRLRIEVVRTQDRAYDLERIATLYEILLRHPGSDEVELFVLFGAGKPRSIPLPERGISYSEQLHGELSGVLGDGKLRLFPLEAASHVPDVQGA
jgi:hypothetical protein